MSSSGPFRIIIDDSRVKSWFNKMPGQIRRRGERGLKEFGNHLVNSLLQQARLVGIRQFRRNRSMFTNTRYVQQQNQGYVLMPKSGLFQDRAKAHYVFRKTISGNFRPMVNAWMNRYGVKGKGFYFKPKPFIKQGVRNARQRLMPIMRPQIQAAIRESH